MTWFDGSLLSQDAVERLGELVKDAINGSATDRNTIGLPAAYRREKHQRVLRCYHSAYLRPMPASPDGNDHDD